MTRRETVEFVIQRVLIPLGGLMGIMLEEFGDSDASATLVAAYLFMMGFSAPALYEALRKQRDDRGGEE